MNSLFKLNILNTSPEKEPYSETCLNDNVASDILKNGHTSGDQKLSHQQSISELQNSNASEMKLINKNTSFHQNDPISPDVPSLIEKTLDDCDCEARNNIKPSSRQSERQSARQSGRMSNRQAMFREKTNKNMKIRAKVNGFMEENKPLKVQGSNTRFLENTSTNTNMRISTCPNNDANDANGANDGHDGSEKHTKRGSILKNFIKLAGDDTFSPTKFTVGTDHHLLDGHKITNETELLSTNQKDSPGKKNFFNSFTDDELVMKVSQKRQTGFKVTKENESNIIIEEKFFATTEPDISKPKDTHFSSPREFPITAKSDNELDEYCNFSPPYSPESQPFNFSQAKDYVVVLRPEIIPMTVNELDEQNNKLEPIVDNALNMDNGLDQSIVKKPVTSKPHETDDGMITKGQDEPANLISVPSPKDSYGNILKELLINALPSGLYSLYINILLGLNLHYISSKNEGDLILYNAIGVGNTWINCSTLVIIYSLNIGLGVKMAQAFGAKYYKLLGYHFHRGVLLNLIVYALCLLFLLFSTPILELIGSDKETAEITASYIRWSFGAIFFAGGFDTLKVYLTAQDIFYPQIYILLFTAAFHALWCEIFINYYDFREKGIALVMTISQGITFFLMAGLLYVRRKQNPFRLTLFSLQKESFRQLWNMFKFEFTIAIMVYLEWIAFDLLIIFTFAYPAEEIAAQVALPQILSIMFQVPQGISSALSTFTGNSMGQKNALKVKRLLKTALVIEMFFIVCFEIILFTAKSEIISFFSGTDILHVIIPIVYVYQVTLPFDFWQTIFNGYIRSIGQERIGTVSFFTCLYLIGMPMAYVLGTVLKFYTRGIWIGMGIGMAVMFLVCSIVIFKTDLDKKILEIQAQLKMENLISGLRSRQGTLRNNRASRSASRVMSIALVPRSFGVFQASSMKNIDSVKSLEHVEEITESNKGTEAIQEKNYPTLHTHKLDNLLSEERVTSNVFDTKNNQILESIGNSPKAKTRGISMNNIPFRKNTCSLRAINSLNSKDENINEDDACLKQNQ